MVTETIRTPVASRMIVLGRGSAARTAATIASRVTWALPV